ncbi:hypothetical protein [Pedobacter sp. SYSU D00535]|uniref:hypothetical protein n=1 Tax=Pedobacter sp. SYSU D00535 TaxID=2810308 RepID=UPI001A95E4D2|nr:hypothetical protein [Pedobacter sp. SYSU D00535]
MNNTGKYIGLNQRIPFEVLDSCIDFYIKNGVIDKAYIFERMQEFTSGANRAAKASKYVAQILKRQLPILNKLRRILKEVPYISLKVNDRKAFCLSLISLTYPITYNLLTGLAQGFKVQTQINKRFISERVMSIYGSNRTVDVAIDALLPMIIELNTIKRDKISLYSLATKLVVNDPFISELVIYTDIKLSGSKSILLDDLSYKPWFLYFSLQNFDSRRLDTLVTVRESAVGKGYLSIA